MGHRRFIILHELVQLRPILPHATFKEATKGTGEKSV